MDIKKSKVNISDFRLSLLETSHTFPKYLKNGPYKKPLIRNLPKNTVEKCSM
ncbi:MAG: hypothetical protein MOIL_01579 [Candidatus Methanolliviera sp. GoM_oil]|nr:MAG: hypothetical protein MOIL_01579 [Candidatus Methanolliviera sp. GoM_oil]